MYIKMNQAVMNHKNMGQELNELKALPFGAHVTKINCNSGATLQKCDSKYSVWSELEEL